MSKSRVNFVCDEIVKIIIDNNLEDGDKLPNEFELSKELNVGRGTIREAMKKLESQNVLVIKQGSGTFVSDKRGVSDDPIGLRFFKDKIKLAKDLLEIRILIEPFIAEMAAIHSDIDDISLIKKYLLKVEDDISRNIDHSHNDALFHKAIAKASKNLVVPKLLPIINQSVKLITNVTYRELTEVTVLHHRELFNAISNHNHIIAKETMIVHINYNRKYINSI